MKIQCDLKDFLELLRGQGLSKGEPDKEFDKAQLKMGTSVEKEHADSPEIAKEIAKDHLKEFPKYYTHLNQMEKEMEDDEEEEDDTGY